MEWANSIMRPIVTQVDPQLKRTILIATKFDNRVKELRSRDEAVQYLRGEGLPANARAFFLSLPVERHAAPAELQDLIEMRYISDYEHLVGIGMRPCEAAVAPHTAQRAVGRRGRQGAAVHGGVFQPQDASGARVGTGSSRPMRLRALR